MKIENIFITHFHGDHFPEILILDATIKWLSINYFVHFELEKLAVVNEKSMISGSR